MKKRRFNWSKKILLIGATALTIAFGFSFDTFIKTEASAQTKFKNSETIGQVSAAVPTNGRIAFVSTRHNTPGSEIYTMKTDGTDVRRITTGNTRDEYDVVWSPDGTKLAFVRQLGDFNQGQIFVINADGTNETRLTNNNADDFNPTWSPDGTKIAFATSRDNAGNGNTEIYMMMADGTNQIRLTNRPGADVEPDWSPDGLKIVYSRQDDDRIYRIYTMLFSGDFVTQITNAGRAHRNPAWSPDGSKIVFLNSDNNWDGVCTINNNGTGMFRVAEDSAFVGYSTTPDWSPDGTKIIYSRSFKLFTANVLGGNETQISPNDSQNTSPSWQTVEVPTVRRPKVDFNGDGKSDFAVYRPTTGEWWIRYNSNGNAVVAQWGNDPSDKPVTADFDGDGKTDLGIYRASEGTWWIVNSPASSAFFMFIQQWGNDPSDVPVPGDYNGDGKAELAIFRRSEGTWWIVNAQGAATPYINIRQWGNPGDIPIPDDYDGDGKYDLAVWRPSNDERWILHSSTGRIVSVSLLGIPVPGDFDGDGKGDIASYNTTNNTYFVQTATGYMFKNMYLPNTVSYVPIAADYDGDGKADFGALQVSGGTNPNAFWYYDSSMSGSSEFEVFGLPGDVFLTQPLMP